jgi:DNA-binding CsgD family transcriptional regulator
MPALPSWLSEDPTRLQPQQVRRLLGAMVILRWIGLVWVGVLGLLTPPRVPLALALIILWIGAYNGWAMHAGRQPDDASVLRAARLVTLMDELTYFVFLAVFTGVATSTVYAIYTFMLVEAIALAGVQGAVQAVALFAAGFGAVQGLRAAVAHGTFPNVDWLLWSLIFVFGAAMLAGVDRILRAGPGSALTATSSSASPPNGGREVRLSEREGEVLRLVAEGYSTVMIASRLHLSESTVKTHVEGLLARLNARNRAEAVAAAWRLHILEPQPKAAK